MGLSQISPRRCKMINPIPPVHSDVTIVVEDSCNCSCYPCRRYLNSPDNQSRNRDRDDEKIEMVSQNIFQRLRNYIFRR